MELNDICYIFDILYETFNEYIVKNTKKVNEYETILKEEKIKELMNAKPELRVEWKTTFCNKDDIVNELLIVFIQLEEMIHSFDVFSKNEEIDDMNSKYIKFLLVPYVLGYLCNETMEIEVREQRVKLAKTYLNEFVHLMSRHQVINIEDYMLEEEYKENPIDRRNMKIKRAKDEQHYQSIFDRITNKNTQMYYKKMNNPNVLEEINEEYRELILSLLKMKVIQSLDLLDLIDTELKVLHVRRTIQNKEESQKLQTNSKDVKKPWSFIIKNNMQMCDVTEIRNHYRNSVFKPFHKLPTVSLEECAKIEMKNALNGNNDENKKDEHSDDELIKNEQNENYYKEKEKEEMQKEIQDREWDDWKDMHPKGIGNTKKN